MVDIGQTIEYLNALSAADEYDFHSFLSFDDRGLDDGLTNVFHGTIEQHKNALLELNSRGAGIHVAVNRTNGMTMKDSGVQRARSFFVDDDSMSVDESALPLPPSMIVQSPRGKHLYWLVAGSVSSELFTCIQKGLINSLGTDHSVHSPGHKMRMPGFFHHKKDPYLMNLRYIDASVSYRHDEITAAFDINVSDYRIPERTRLNTNEIAKYDISTRMSRARAMLASIGPAERGSGHGHSKSLSACRVANDFALEDEDFVPLLLEWGDSCSPPWNPSKLVKFYRSSVTSINQAKWPWGNKLVADRPDFIKRREAPRFEPQAPRGYETAISGIDDAYPPVGDGDDDDPPAPAKKKRGRPPKKAQGGNIGDGDEDDRNGDGDEPNRASPSGRKGVSPEASSGSVSFDRASRKPQYISDWLVSEYSIRTDDTGSIYIYRNNVWQETSAVALQKLAMQYTSFKKVTMRDLREAVNLSLSRRHIYSIEWNKIGQDEIALDNGVYNFMRNTVRPHNEDDYLDRVIPIKFNPSARCDLWERCLNEWMPGMPQEVDGLQQFFGYILMSHARYKKALVLYGPSNTGKSQVIAVASALAGGRDNVCSISPDKMDDPRALAPIKGKALNVVADMKKSAVLADGGFKQLVSTGDPVQIDQKFTRSEMYYPTAKHLFATNNLPSITDSTAAVFNRLMILPFKNVIPLSEQDSDIEKKLMAEMEGILNWAIHGAIKLNNSNGHWPIIDSCEEIISEYRLNQNPLSYFIAESGRVVESPDSWIYTEELRDAVNEFNDSGRPYGRKGFASLVDGALGTFPHLKRAKLVGKSVIHGLAWADSQTRLKLA